MDRAKTQLVARVEAAFERFRAEDSLRLFPETLDQEHGPVDFSKLTDAEAARLLEFLDPPKAKPPECLGGARLGK